MFDDLFNKLVYILPAVIIALCCHEAAHSFVAYKLGDHTQKESGRMSLNPLHHLDPIGALCLLFTGFGWAKPVQIDPWYFKDRKNGMIYSAMAGPVVNLILGFIFTVIYIVMMKSLFIFKGDIPAYLTMLCFYTAIINIGLGVFNLIPIPPLDGSKILLGILKEETYFKILRYEQVISIVLIALLLFGMLDGPLIYARNVIFEFYSDIANTITPFL